MMFTVSCETFCRLSEVSLQPGDTDPREYLRCVRLENRGGKSFAIATTGKLMAVELIGDTHEKDGAVNVTIADDLMQQCEAGVEAGASLMVTLVEATGFAMAMTGNYMFPGDASIKGVWPVDWRKLIPDHDSKNSSGVFSLNGEVLARLGRASPSGTFVMPLYTNAEKPVIVRDTIDPNWIGIFMTAKTDDETNFGPAVIPDWAKDVKQLSAAL